MIFSNGEVLAASLLLFASLSAAAVAEDPIARAIERYGTVESYRVTLRSRSDGATEMIRYSYKKPGFVRMEFVSPRKGAVLVYRPDTKEVRVRPLPSLRFLVFTFDPDNTLIKSSKGHRVDASDFGELFKRVKILQDNGRTEVAGEGEIGGRPAVHVIVKGKGAFAIEGIHEYSLWLDKKTDLPLKTTAYDAKGKMMEEVLTDDLETGVEFPDDLFVL